MNVKKAIKRIAALAGATTMVSATIMGAAADLGNYPAPFVENGVFNGKIVVGSMAKTSDVIGAIDIAASLQAESRTPINVDGSVGVVQVSGGAQIKSSSSDFNLGDNLSSFSSGLLRSRDMPELLGDGEVEDNDGPKFKYEQSIQLGDAALKFGRGSRYGNDPVFYLDLNGATTKEIVYRVRFKDNLKAHELEDSESITMFGESFTFDPNNAVGEDLVLYGSDTTVFVNQGEPVTIEVGGVSYTIDVLGGNSGQGTANVRVTGGGSTQTKTVQASQSTTIGGLSVFVSSVFINDIGGNDISVEFFVGSNKVIIPHSAVGSPGTYREIEINDESRTKVYARIDGTIDAITDIYFKVNPTDFDDPGISNRWNWLVMGENDFVDPLFGFKLSFTGMTPSLDNREVVEIDRLGDTYVLSFTNNDGDEYIIDLYEKHTTNQLRYGDENRMKFETDTFAEQQFFILESTESKPGDRTTYVFEVTRIDQGEDEVLLREIGKGTTLTLESGVDEIENTGVYVNVTGANEFELKNSANANVDSARRVITKEGLRVYFGDIASDEANITFVEDEDDMDEAAQGNFTVKVDIDASDDLRLGSFTWSTGTNNEASDSSGNVKYGMSAYGTFVEQDTDDKGRFLRVHYSGLETEFNVFLKGPDAIVVTTGGSSGGTAYTINEFVVGQSAVLDSEGMGLLGRTPLIVVGGPCVNTVAMNLMGNPEVCTEGFTQGRAKIRFFSARNALLVAGFSADDTVGASYVLADYRNYDLVGSEVEVITTDLTDLEVRSIA